MDPGDDRGHGRADRGPGAEVTPDTVVLELSNPELEQTALEAELQLKAAEARLTSRQAEVDSQLLTQRSALATVQAELTQATLQAEAGRRGRSRAGTAADRHRVGGGPDGGRTGGRGPTLWRLRLDQRGSESARGLHGVLQQVRSKRANAWAGSNLARVGDPSLLKAELRIAETQAGHSDRSVGVNRYTDGPLPRGARPDLTVDGSIELERLDDVVFVGRPVFGQEQSIVSLFKLDADGDGATRTRVHLGRASVNTIEVLDGLAPGDRVILSDMSTWDAFDRIRLN